MRASKPSPLMVITCKINLNIGIKKIMKFLQFYSTKPKKMTKFYKIKLNFKYRIKNLDIGLIITFGMVVLALIWVLSTLIINEQNFPIAFLTFCFCLHIFMQEL